MNILPTTPTHFTKNYLIILVSVFLLGCQNVMGAYNYHLELRNVGDKNVDQVEASSSKGFFTTAGIVIPKTGKTFLGPMKYPFRDKFTVKWVADDKQKFSKSLD